MHEIIGKHVVQLMLIAGRNHYDALLSAMPEKRYTNSAFTCRKMLARSSASTGSTSRMAKTAA